MYFNTAMLIRIATGDGCNAAYQYLHCIVEQLETLPEVQQKRIAIGASSFCSILQRAPPSHAIYIETVMRVM